MSWTNPPALADALFAQCALPSRAVQAARPAVFSVEAPAAAALGTWLGHGVFLHCFPELKAVGVQVGGRVSLFYSLQKNDW